MNTNELMDGDLVLDTKTNKPRRYSAVDCPYVSQYAPLPISREILEKNGFAYCASSGAFICWAEESYAEQDVSVGVKPCDLQRNKVKRNHHSKIKKAKKEKFNPRKYDFL